jgi:hypothetical protein
MPIRRFLLLLTCATGVTAAETAILTHGDMAITIPLPSGTETGTRFDAGSMALRATWRGRALFGSYTHLNYPETNTAAGFAEEYDSGDRNLPPGFASAGEGEAFLKLAVGALRRGSQPYVSWKTQPVAERGTWHAERGPDWAELRWDSPVVGPTACSLVRRLTLRADGFSVERRLINRGQAAITTEHYAHHFLTFEGRPLATGYEVELGYTPPAPAEVPAPLRISGRLITIGELPAKWTPTTAAALVLPGPSAAEADTARTVTVRHRGLGLALRMVADHPPVRTVIYAAPQVICPESFVDLVAPPGGEVAWRTDYTVSEEP